MGLRSRDFIPVYFDRAAQPAGSFAFTLNLLPSSGRSKWSRRLQAKSRDMVRFKNRWLLVEFIPCPEVESSKRLTNGMNAKQIWSAIKQSVLDNFGDSGWGAVGLSLTVKYYSPTTNICIIRVGRDHHRIAWGAVTLLPSIEGQKYIPNVVHVSGTIKHAQLAAIRHNREVIARYRAKTKIAATYQDAYEGYLQNSTLEIEALQD